MKKNAGKTDRIVRGVIAVAALGAAFAMDGTGRWVALAVAVVAGATAAAGHCPLYTAFGLCTCAENCPTKNPSEA